jgi:hypothetical protein
MARQRQATLTAGDRTVCVKIDSVRVYRSGHGAVTWMVTSREMFDYCERHALLRGHTTCAVRWPAELSALIWGVLTAECPLQPLTDWIIENGPRNLAAELEAMQPTAQETTTEDHCVP